MEILENNKLREIIDRYFYCYFENKFDELNPLKEKIKYFILSREGFEIKTKQLFFYIKLLVKNERFIKSFTRFPSNLESINEKINLLENRILQKKDNKDIENLLFFSAEQIILFLYYTDIIDFSAIKQIPKNPYPQLFNYVIKNESDKKTIFFFIEKTENVDYCEYIGKIMPINNKKYEGVYDYHLPIFKLIELYTDCNICLTNDIDYIAHNTYIYVHTIEHIYRFFEKYGAKFHKTVPSRVFEDINKGKAILILNSAQEGLTISDFYYQIQQSIKANFTPEFANNIILLSGNEFEKKQVTKYNSNKIIPSAKPFTILLNYWQSAINKEKINSFPFRYFETCIAVQFERTYKHYNYEKKLNALENLNFKSYLCFNGHKKEFRYALCFLLWEQNLLKEGFVSLRSLKKIDECSKPHKLELINKILLKDKTKFEAFIKKLPLIADKPNLYLNYWYQVDLDLINNTFLWVITETTFGGQFYNFSFSFLTEKTYKPIALFMPFVIVGDRHSIKALKSEGYKTFDRWWNEEYDNILNQKDRLVEIVKIIQFICSKSNAEKLKMYEEMKEILLHNHHNLMTRNAATEPVQYILNRFNNLQSLFQ